ncbi:hypothetical protein DN069_07965 [Streptacidiphilus pinicola]|uniref:Uncharacterized protein n=1 Tax=Streptacidiphilus pinicola TaxID=2219663 RepID=A0A2X0INF7_9ACTN|nr:hypothetical protein DN069_07965 [Streptacidiphilus pinicola]
MGPLSCLNQARYGIVWGAQTAREPIEGFHWRGVLRAAAPRRVLSDPPPQPPWATGLPVHMAVHTTPA